ncbi:Ger(x)C family spore germination protein [Salicibibacter halophilus]|uniref:Ger(X)C family spore germination protein n=1 Tax=Salicibibacter halophilus TaxID=2502791 RepID=A0A514LJ02_9BACI|nr:Ger(x)C family spore germination protein [Salicibibacter halophilus]QDI91814.1 Ger(x)C family spore germination protein [Salicibibacter halophilus]
MKICIRSFLILIIVVSLSGCWDQWELNEISIISGIAIDQGDNGDYVLNMQVINPSELAITEEAAGLSPVAIYEVSGTTIHEAAREILKEAPRRAYFSHMASLIISEEIAEEGLEDVMDFFYRDHEVRSDYMILIAKDGSAHDILEMVPRLEGVGSINILHSIEHGEQSTALIDGVRMGELLQKTLSAGVEPSLLGVSAVGDMEKAQTTQNVESTKPKGHRVLDSTAIFRNNQLVGWLDESQSKAFQYADGAVQDSAESVPCPDVGTMAIESLQTEPEIVVSMDNGPQISRGQHPGNFFWLVWTCRSGNECL